MMLLFILLLCPVWVRASVKVPLGQAIVLNMSDDSVDDMYLGCNKTMSQRVKEKFFIREKVKLFDDVWKKAKKCADRKMKQREAGEEALTANHLRALCVYTSNYKDFYQTFNDHVRVNASIYDTSFPFHALHFWLTSAIQILGDNRGCDVAYRRSNRRFSVRLQSLVRFGSFTSTSRLTSLTKFGNTTCFQITTCCGAYLKSYSYLNREEEEVLVPPYEMFQVVDGSRVKGLDDCDVVHILQSAGVHSNLNCRVANDL